MSLAFLWRAAFVCSVRVLTFFKVCRLYCGWPRKKKVSLQGPETLHRRMKGAIAKKIGLLKAIRQHMNKSPLTIKGYVTAVPRSVDARQARVAVIQDDVEYRIVPRGAGVDLDDEVSLPVEVTGQHEEVDGVNYLVVRGYTVLEDDSWLEE